MGSTTSGSGIGQMLLLLLPLLLLVYLMFSARRRAKVIGEMQASLTVGAEVIMTSGLHGRILALDADTVTLDANGTQLVFDRRAVATTRSSEAGV